MDKSMFSGLSPLKQALLELDDEQVFFLLKAAQHRSEGTKTASKSELFQLPPVAKARLESLKKQERLPGMHLNDDDLKWMRYAKLLEKTPLNPALHKAVDDRVLYTEIKAKCMEKHLAPDFAKAIVPSVIQFLQGEPMQPLLFSGPPGTGKTTAGQFLAEWLSLPLALISAPRAETGHGYSGEGKTFKGADVGEIASNIFRNRSMSNLFLIDEVDKAAQKLDNRVRQQDELLNIVFDRRVEDNFLEFPISLERSPFVFAVNDIGSLSNPFIDRCMVIEFPSVQLERMHLIIRDFTASLLEKRFKEKVIFHDQLLCDGVTALHKKGVASIRQHQQLVRNAIDCAYVRYLESTSHSAAEVLDSDVRNAVERLSGSSQRSIGF